MKLISVLFLLSISSTALVGQVAGRNGFDFVNNPINPLGSMTGTGMISHYDGDALMASYNPATIGFLEAGVMSGSRQFYYADMKGNHISSIFNLPKLGKTSLGLESKDFGDFVMRDISGQEEGMFKVQDITIRVSNAHRVGPITMGVSAKYLASSISNYKSEALVADIGGVFKVPDREIAFGLVVRNLGGVISSYTSRKTELPIKVNAGATFKPQHMPIRFTINYSDVFGQVSSEEADGILETAGNWLKHLSTGLELMLSKSFQFRYGYNHGIRTELRNESRTGMTGMAWGFVIKTRKFDFDFSRSYLHLVGGSTMIGLTSNLMDIFKKRI